MQLRPRSAAVVVAAVCAGLLTGVQPAQGLPPGAVTLPVAEDPSLSQTVSVVGADPDRLLAVTTAWNGRRFWTAGADLVAVPGVAGSRVVLVGDTVVWPVTVGGVLQVHRRDLGTGVETVEDGGTDVFVTAGPTGWLATSGGQLVFRSGTTRRVLLPGLPSSGVFTQMDATTALFSYVPAGTGTVHLAASDLATGTLNDLGTLSSSSLFTLTPSSYVWMQTPATPALVRQDRATGVRTTVPAPGPASVARLAATDTATAWVAVAGGMVVLPTAPGAAQVPVPGPWADVDARGTGFVASRSGTAGVSGLWSVSAAGTASKAMPLPAVPERYTTLDLDNGRVVYAGGLRRGPLTGRDSALARTVSGTTTLVAGAESTLAADPAFVGVSGTRRALATLDTGLPIDFVDGGTVTGRAVGARAKVSGPYAVVDGTLPYRVSGSRVALPAADGTPVASDVYGSRFAYVRTDGTVRLLDATKALSATNPVTVGTGACTTCAFVVGIAADTVAWSTSAAPFGVAYDVRAKTTRTLGLTPGAVGDGVVVSTAGAAFDLATPGSAAVVLGPANGSLTLAAADDHRVAWTGPDGAITVARLPFGTAHRPRVLGVVARSAFSPNADGSADTWAPAFDLSKPVPAVTLTIRSGTTVVRTLTGTGALGSVRDLVWDGRNTAGSAAPDGSYTWTLTGAAADGEGGVAAVDGTGAATGTVIVDRVAETVTLSATSSTAATRTTGGIPLTWKPAGAASRAAAVYDVRWRMVMYDFDRDVVVYDTAQALRTGTTATAYTVPESNVFRGSTYQFAARVRDGAGNTGPWSAWVDSQQSLDDRDLFRTAGPWSSSTASGSFLGTTTTATSQNAMLDGAVIGSRLYVWATTCPTCGEMRVGVATRSVGGSSFWVVDTRSATTKRKVLVLSKVLPRGYQSVTIMPWGTSGRPRIYVDAVGSDF
ncbi:FlgD immunoglobulin-like domain containing protein [Kineosporia sp. A_224]|uniref:FlgD immunoglobulin-like domain containing protein n=1 Tax=Kineosporia sp. A_224 TaxID=1962180 RepID=UPI000B4BC122|nr:FlgD immunoglobulin-like domain containing protein [Kineosporia sp. A_224]